MRKMGICSCVIGVAAVVCMVSIWDLKSVKTKGMSADAIDTVLEEESDSSVEQTETGSSDSEPETEQSIYKSPITDEDYELIFATRSFAESVEDYVVYEFDYQGEEPQREIVLSENFEDPEDIPPTAIVVSEETITLMSMTRAVCAIEYFCGTDFRIIDTYYMYMGGIVQFEYDNHEYTCITKDTVSGYMEICDAVFEACPTAGSNTKWYEPDEIKITEPDDGFIELRETAKTFLRSVEEYVIYEYEYKGGAPKRGLLWLEHSYLRRKRGIEDRGNNPDSIVIELSKKRNIDYLTMKKALCAIEDFCGGTDFRIEGTYYVGSGGSVQFIYDNHEYTCISEACVTDEMKICDAVFEVHSTAGINITTPCVPDEIKVRDEEGVFQTLLTY